jgi:diaminopimelate epimerase
MERWSAHGNVYLVTTEPIDADGVRREVGDADGIAQVTAHGDDWADVVIWNPDGSTAEMSGNATRIVAAWLGAEHTRVRVGAREVVARRTEDARIEQELAFKVLGQERVDGIDLVAVDVGNPHAVVVGDPAELPRLGPLLETHPRFPQRTNVQVAHVDGPGRVTARVWERGVGETAASGTSAVAVAAATHGEGRVVVTFPGGELEVKLGGETAWLTGAAERVS